MRKARGLNTSVSAEVTPNLITLSARSIHAKFDRDTGMLVYLGKKTNMIMNGPQLNVWRAGTDNDGIKLLSAPTWSDSKPLSRWIRLGLAEIKFSLISVKYIHQQGQLSVVEIISTVSGRENWADFYHRQRYMLLPSGELNVENTIRLGKDMFDIPRVGVMMGLVPGLEQIEYYGRGPYENYWDRKASSMVGCYQNTVSGEYVPYIMPQEYGHHTDVRWLALKDEKDNGLEVIGYPTFEFNVSHFTANDLFNGKHTIDLHPRLEVILSIDAVMRGLGTASCGPDTLEQYQIRSGEYKFTYGLRII